MNSRLFALLLFSLSAHAQTPAAETPTDVILIDRVESLFRETNRRFGPANVEILQDLTAGFLAECDYHAVAPHEIESDMRVTHSLTVQYSIDKAQATHKIELVLAPLPEVAPTLKNRKTERRLLAQGAFRAKASKRKKADARANLFQDAEDVYFLQLKKFSQCRRKR